MRIVGRVWLLVKLVFGAMTFAISVGVTVGFFAALKPGSLSDTAWMIGAISGLSVSQFWFGLMLMYLFALTLKWLPSFGYGDGGFTHAILPPVALGGRPTAPVAPTPPPASPPVPHPHFAPTPPSYSPLPAPSSQLAP